MAFETLEGIEVVHGKVHKFDGTIEELKKLRAKKSGKAFFGIVLAVQYTDEDGDLDEELLDVNLFGEAHKKAKTLKLEKGRRIWVKGKGSVRRGDTNPDVRFSSVNVEKAKGIRVTPWGKK